MVFEVVGGVHAGAYHCVLGSAVPQPMSLKDGNDPMACLHFQGSACRTEGTACHAAAVDRSGNFSFANIGAARGSGAAEERAADAGTSSTFEVRRGMAHHSLVCAILCYVSFEMLSCHLDVPLVRYSPLS